MAPRLTDPRPVPAWLDETGRAAFEQADRDAEAKAWRDIELRVRNEPGVRDPAPIMAALRRAVEVWRFERQRYEADPQPAQWESLLRAIEVPDTADLRGIEAFRRAVHRLPAHVLAILNTVLFERASIGTVVLFQRIQEGDRDMLPLLRDALRDMADGLKHVRARPGPGRLKPVSTTQLRLVHAAITTTSEVPTLRARELAAALLRLCAIPAPSTRGQLAKLLA
jgi:hypothetical protein